MAYIDGYGNLQDGQPPSYDDTNGQYYDPPPPLPNPHKPPRLRSRNVRYDVQGVPRGYWATKEGKLIHIRAMSDQHITNSLAMMERNCQSRGLWTALAMMRYASSAPDGAADAATEEAGYIFDMVHDKNVDRVKLSEMVWPKYTELKQEQQRRNAETPGNHVGLERLRTYVEHDQDQQG